MTQKSPVRVNYDQNGNATGFSEFLEPEFIGIEDGGTGAITAAGARTALGIAIGTDVQAYDVDLATIAGLSHSDGNFIVSNGSAWVVESGSTARDSLGLGTSDSPTFTNLTLSNDLTISGDLTVQGDTVTINTSTVTIEDVLMKLGEGNTLDTVDLGWYGEYQESSTTKYLGFTWDASQDKFILWTGNETEPNTLVDTGDSGHATATLIANIEGNVTATSVLADGVTATTQSALDNSTKVATTEYVDSAVALENELAEMNDVTLTNSQDGDFLRYNGSVWINDAVDLATDTVGDFVQSITAGDGLAIDVTSGEQQTPTLSVNVDDSSIEIATDTLQVKALGITDAMLAGSISNAKLTNSKIVATDGTTPTDINLGDTITFTGGAGVDIVNTAGNFEFTFDLTEVNAEVAEAAQDAIDALLAAGTQTRITVSYDDGSNSLSYTVDDDLANYDNTNTAFIDLTDLSATTSTGVTYDNATGVIALASIPNTSLTNSSITVSDGSNTTDIALGDTVTFTGGAGVDITNTAGTLDFTFDLTEVTSEVIEQAQDALNSAFAAGTQTRIAVAYDDNADSFSFTVEDDLSLYDNTTSAFIDLTDLSVATGSGLTYDSATGEFGTSAIPNAQLANDSITINSYSTALGGTVTLVTDDIAEDVSPTNLWYTDARVGSYLTTNNYATQSYVDSAVASENEISEMNDVTLTSLASGEFLQYNGTAWVNIDLDTDDIDEGSNLFYTTTRANTDIDARVTKSFVDALNVDADTLDGNDSTAFATAAQGTLADSALQSGDNITELTNNANYIDLTDLSGTSGVTYDNTTGQISIGQAVGTNDNVTFNDVTVSGTLNSDDVTATTMTVSNDLVVTGDLTVQGTTTTLNTDTVSTEENMIKLASGNIGNGTDIGIYGKVVQSSTTKYVGLHWDPGTGQNKFKLFDSLTVEPGATVDTADASYNKATLVADIEGDVTGALTGNADTATALASAQNFSLTGDVTASAISFDGTGAVALSTSVTESAVTQHEAALSINESQITFTSNFLENLVEDTTPQLGGTLDANGNTIDMGVNVITDTKVGQWDTAYGWGDHSLAGYLTSETSHADVLVDGDFTTAGIMATDGSGTYSIVTDNSTNWNTAYSWGDHSTAGYLTSFTETNDLTSAVTWANVPDANITESSVTQHQAALSITESQITDLGTYLENINSLSIDELSDVDTSTVAPTNGQALVWDNANSVWEPGNISSTLSALTDTTISSPSNGEALVYNSSTGQWENSAVGVGTMSSFTISDGVTSESISDSDTVTFAGTANEVTVAVSATDTVTIGLPTSITVDVTGNVTGTVSSLSNHDTDDLTEGVTNLYYSSTLFDTDFSGKTTTDLNEGTNLYYTTARFDTAFSGKDTDDLNEGTTNFYYTDARVGTYLTTNSYATESYVDTAVSNLVDSAPAALDTLNELAAALGDDANFSTTVTNSIATKLAITDFSTYFDTDFAAKSIDDLTDVDTTTTSPTTNQALVWDGSNWVPGTVSLSGGGAEGILTFTHYDNTSDNIDLSGGKIDFLHYDDTEDDIAFSENKITFLHYDDVQDDINLISYVRLDDIYDVDITGSSSGAILKYNAGTSTWITSTVPTEIDNYITGGTGVTYSSGDISIGQSVGTTDNVTFSTVTADLIGNVTGNVTGDVTGDINGAVIVTGKNESGSTIAAGVPVYISGQASSGTEFTVDVADADGSGTMPAIGITTASANNNAEVSILTFGKYVGLNTSSFSVGDELYVSTSGTLTTTAPTGETALLQKIAKVIRSHATDGEIFVQGAGRSNAVPNLDSGDIFIGNASNQAVTASFNTTFDTQLATKDTDDINEGSTNLYYTNARFDTQLGTKDTDDISEGSTNLYYTNARFDTQLGTKDTDDLTEGTTNQYFTDARADARIAAASIDDLSDVDTSTTSPTNGQALVWNSTNSEWEPGTISGGGGATAIDFLTTTGSKDYIEVEDNVLPFFDYLGNQDDLPVISSLAFFDYVNSQDDIDLVTPAPFEDHIRDEDGSTAVTTTNEDNVVQIYTNSTERVKVDNSGTVDITSGKLTIAGSAGSDNQALTTDGSGNISWGTVDSTKIKDLDNTTSVDTTNTAETIEFTANSSLRASLDGSMSMEASGGFFNHRTTVSATDITIPSGTGTVSAGPITVTGTVTVEGVLAII
jgi:hypothetical protein